MIDIHYSNSTRTVLSQEVFFKAINVVLKNHGITDNVELELKIIGSQVMQRLNKAHRNKDYATDVLSFPIWPNLDIIKEQNETGHISLGSVVVCLPVARKQATEEGKSLEETIIFLIEHSLLHLMGFHHEGDE